jgi:Ca2+-binding EF-hand superfamily protein
VFERDNAEDEIVTLQSGISHEKEWLEKMQQLFGYLDKDKSGSVGVREIKHMLRRVGQESREESRDHAKQILKIFDENEDGKVTLKEMVDVMDSVKPDEAKTMITDMLKNIHLHRHRNHILAPGTPKEDPPKDDEPIKPRYKQRESVVEMDIESQDVVNNMLHQIAEFQRSHKDGMRMLLVRCITEIKKHNSIPPKMLEGLERDEKQTLQSIQIAVTVASGANLLQILEFMLSQLPPAFGQEVQLKAAPQKPTQHEATLFPSV